jgi:HK97 family phage major capsid protein
MKHLSNQAKSIQGRGDAEGRDLNPQESKNLDRILNEFEEVSRELNQVKIEMMSASAEEEDEACRAPQARATGVDPIAGSDPTKRRRVGARRLPANNSTGELFGQAPADPYANRFTSLGDLALAVASNRTDPRLITNAGMTEGSGPGGGFLVPPQFMGEILDAALAQEIIRPRALVLPMASSTLSAPGFNYLDGSSGKRGGLQLLWSGESSALTEQVPAARKVDFVAKKAAILVRVSSELAEDVAAFDRQLQTAMVAAVASGLDIAFFLGTGAGQPLGIINAPCTVTVPKETSQTAATINLTNLAKMLGRLAPGSYRNAVWLAHPTTLPQLYALTVTIRNQADTENVGGSFAGVTQASDGTLRIFGIPVVVTDACSVLGTAGDIVLADLSRYAVGMRREAIIQRSDERYFESDEIGFKLTLRCDGQPLDGAAVKLRDGTNTVSPFVALANR